MNTRYLSVLAFVLVSFTVTAIAAETKLIPSRVNELLPLIATGMTSSEVRDVFTKSFPELKTQDGPESGGSGWIGFSLNAKFSVMVSAVNRDGKLHVGDNIKFMIFDYSSNVRYEITQYHWKEAKENSHSK